MNAVRRSRTDAEALAGLARRLTARDYAVLDFFAQHRIATTSIVAAVFFTRRRLAAIRLHELCELGLLTRSRVTGSRAYRYTLDWGGAAICALRAGTTPPTRAAAAWTAQQVFHSAHRPHREAVNAFFAQLHLAARASGSVRVSEWLPEAAASAEIIHARPDAAGELTWDDGRKLRLWYEHDRGTETLAVLAEKITRYRTGRLAGALGDRILLFGLSGPRRLNGLLRVCPPTGDLTVAATVTEPLAAEVDLRLAKTGILTDHRWQILGSEHVTSLEALAR
jgi:hypothetical protein